jgi:hypothetical protein
MPTPGSNLPRFLDTQLEFAAHIRDPSNNPCPSDVEARRMQVYVDLFYNNIQAFLANIFRITKSVLGSDAWHLMVRAFVARHRSTSPYFQEIPQEFLAFLDGDRSWEDAHPFLLELCHYEWVELALDVSVDELPADLQTEGDLLDHIPLVSPLAWSLCYDYPVHRISPEHVPQSRPGEPTYLIVYRGSDERVHFVESNAVTARLLTILSEPGSSVTGRQALETIASELLFSDAQPDADAVMAGGADTLQRLRGYAIIVGTRAS